MLAKGITVITIIAGIVLATILTVSQPATAGPVGVLAVFFLVYVVLVGIFAWSGFIVGRLLEKLTRKTMLRRPMQKVSFLHAYYIASVLALGPIILLGINTVNKIGVYEIGLVIILVVIGIFYIQKRIK